jgi:protein TonB
MTPSMPASPEQPQIPLMTAVVQQPAEPDIVVEMEASPRPPQRPAPPVSTVEQAAQVASGAGGGAAAGTVQPTDSVSQTAASVTNAAKQWAAAIKGQIERAKRYPSNAGGASGSAVVVLTVGNDGRLVGVSVSASSGNRALDRAAVDAVRRAGQFPAAPTGLTNARYSFSLTISFEV